MEVGAVDYVRTAGLIFGVVAMVIAAANPAHAEDAQAKTLWLQ